jgi:Zn-dependent M28 family amino/carboxypeptidase
MKNISLSIIAGLALVASANGHAQSLLTSDEIATADTLANSAAGSHHAYDIVTDLTTKIGPRLAGTEADKRAVQWAKEMLEDSGFDRVTLESIEFPVWEREIETARIISPYPQPLRVTALGYSGSTDGEISAEVVAFQSLDELEKATGEQVAGKIVFVNLRTERTRTGRGYGAAVSVRRDAHKFAAEKGGLAVLIRSIGTDSHRFPHTGAMSYNEEGENLPSGALSAPDADQLERILASGETVEIAMNLSTSLVRTGSSHNVVADIVGRELPEEIILLGAHLDSWDLGTGAIDDGAGVAIVSAAARLIAALPQRPRRTIRVVLFGNEEQGLWGARQYAELHADELANHVMAMESDFGANRIWQFESRVEDERLPLMDEIAAQLTELGVERGGNEARGGPDVSPLREAGVAVLTLQQDGHDYFDLHHTPDDTLDKIDPQALQQNVAVYAVVGYLLAEH